ncbi:MAG: hypothetical protein AAF821_13555 [Cyanobacteria bacterium P01_D01_bin.156]
MNSQFLDAVFTDGIQHPNFFNGRILTASDLRDEQAANLQRSRYLGQAVGSGVAYGLQVTGGQTALSITAGLAINRRGDGLCLPAVTTVELVLTEPLGNPQSPFVPCDVAGATTLTGQISTGYYLLAITSATRLSITMAPNSGLDGDSPGCTNRYEEMGVQFKLISLINDDFVSPIPTTALDRSRLAHECFGTNQLRVIAAEPQQQPTTYGLVDRLYENSRLTDCDVPLAVFHFQASVLQFVDMWPVRRLAIASTHWDAYLQDPFSGYITPRREAEAAAFLLQFQAHLEDLRTTGSPTTLVAEDYFEYLPAAGYLPIRSTSTNSRRFRVDDFFNTQNLPTEPLLPEQLRALFQESFYRAPIRPGLDDVDIYQVVGAPDLDPYRIFVRRTPILLSEPEDEPGDEPPAASGDLYVVVLSRTGEEIDADYIQFVRATNIQTGRIYVATKRAKQPPFGSFSQRTYAAYVKGAQEATRLKYAAVNTAVTENRRTFQIESRNPGPYIFNDLPAGTYTVNVEPTLSNLYGPGKVVTVRAKVTTTTDIIVGVYGSSFPINVDIADDYLNPEGVIVEGYRVNVLWPTYYVEWEKDLFAPNVGDPPGEDWVLRDDPLVALQLEEVMERQGINDPRVATADAVIYIRRDYNPTQTSETVTAFVQTRDGSRFPAVPLAADNALDKPATVDRTEISDFDRATVDQLQNVGLAGVDAIASAPTKLIAGVLGQSVEYSTSLINDAQTTLQEDFRNGYLGYPGITKAQSDDLKASFGDRVELANATPEDLSAILGDRASSGFVNRFLADVSNSVPTSAIDLASVGISEADQANLAEIGVTTNKTFRDLGATAAGREQLQETLNVSEATVNRYLETAAVNYAQGQLITAPEKSIGTLVGVPADVKATLANAGIGSAKELANADPDEIVTVTGISREETTGIIESAIPFGSRANITLVQGALKSDVDVETIESAGLTSARAISRADTERVTGTGLDQAAVANLRSLGERLLGQDQLFRRF